MLFSRYVKGVLFCNGRYTKGVPFLSKMVYERVRGWTSGLSIHRLAVLTKTLDMDSRK